MFYLQPLFPKLEFNNSSRIQRLDSNKLMLWKDKSSIKNPIIDEMDKRGSIFSPCYLYKVVLLFVFCCLVEIGYGQDRVIYNSEWESMLGNPINCEWMSSVLDNSDNVITIGNTLNSVSGDIELYLTKQNSMGALVWDTTFSIVNADCFGVKAAIDSQNNIFVAATSKNASTKHDYLILKFNSYGSLVWSTQINGTGNGDDIPSGIQYSELSNSVYVTGVSQGVNSDFDYWTMSLSGSTGASNWNKRYDYAGLLDAPLSIELSSGPSAGAIIVTGVSLSSSSQDLALLEYSGLNGAVLSENRISNAGINFYLPTAFDKDVVGNIYITGSVLSSPTNFDIKTIKIDTSFNVSWQVTEDISSSIDSATCIKVDPSGNVYVSGYYYNSIGDIESVLFKYDNSGNLLWQKFSNAYSGYSTITRGIFVEVNSIFLVQEIFSGTTSQIRIKQYSPSGEIKGVESGISFGENSKNMPWSFLINSSNNFILSGINELEGKKSYFTALYSRLELEDEIVFVDSVASHLAQEVIVVFNPGVVNSNFINNTNKRFGKIAEALDSTIISDIETKIIANDFSEWYLMGGASNVRLG
jgi:hypothetical protein